MRPKIAIPRREKMLRFEMSKRNHFLRKYVAILAETVEFGSMASECLWLHLKVICRREDRRC